MSVDAAERRCRRVAGRWGNCPAAHASFSKEEKWSDVAETTVLQLSKIQRRRGRYRTVMGPADAEPSTGTTVRDSTCCREGSQARRALREGTPTLASLTFPAFPPRHSEPTWTVLTLSQFRRRHDAQGHSAELLVRRVLEGMILFRQRVEG